MLKSWYLHSGPNFHDSAPETTGNVVAKPTVGFGPPDIVIVGAEATGVVVTFADDDAASAMVNRDETAYVMPVVELRKKRK